jgi:thioesterase domain-containing protein
VILYEKNSNNKLLIAYVLTKMNEIEIVEQLNKKLKAVLPSYMIPNTIVVLQAFSKTLNGKIDHKALPIPEYKLLKQVKSWSDNARTNIEFKLIQIWQELLDCESIGIKDNFFKLGGHSLLGIRLLAKIKSMFGKEISFLVLLENSTIADLAMKISQDVVLCEHKVWSPLVAIQPKGEYPPLFCIHPAGGTVFCYLDLATQLEKKRQPLYGLQAQGLDERQTLLKTTEEMAASYLQAIRSIQAKGPYFLLGWSAGGMIAYEIAQQLYRSGEKVAFLGILDTYAYAAKNSRISALVLDDEIELLARLYIKEDPYTELPNDLIKILNKLKPRQQLTYIVKQAKILGKLPCDISDKQAERLVRAFKNDCMLVRKYKPTSYFGKITVFRPVEALIMEKEKSNDLDWGFLTKQKIEIYETPGNHFNMLFYPNVKILAAKIWECLKKHHLSNEKVPIAIFD